MSGEGEGGRGGRPSVGQEGGRGAWGRWLEGLACQAMGTRKGGGEFKCTVHMLCVYGDTVHLLMLWVSERASVSSNRSLQLKLTFLSLKLTFLSINLTFLS